MTDDTEARIQALEKKNENLRQAMMFLLAAFSPRANRDENIGKSVRIMKVLTKDKLEPENSKP
ncbi:hypothetical protein SAE02_67640 [Skermanella aerolata]|uniref:Transposase n=1 Tax=Skermanella aerolata TaxID=393310 RepID=A0A512E1R0_9PROT|nr:hypothetical protein [Skermanella aerolata]GEO42616.1 hypothetical protein SAE02_67640 [Skermanella aerolata]